MMNICTIGCRSCGEAWKVDGSFSDYERIELESRPCPHCFATTLAVSEPVAAKRAAGPRRAGFMKNAERNRVKVA